MTTTAATLMDERAVIAGQMDSLTTALETLALAFSDVSRQAADAARPMVGPNRAHLLPSGDEYAVPFLRRLCAAGMISTEAMQEVAREHPAPENLTGIRDHVSARASSIRTLLP